MSFTQQRPPCAPTAVTQPCLVGHGVYSAALKAPHGRSALNAYSIDVLSSAFLVLIFDARHRKRTARLHSLWPVNSQVCARMCAELIPRELRPENATASIEHHQQGQSKPVSGALDQIDSRGCC